MHRQSGKRAGHFLKSLITSLVSRGFGLDDVENWACHILMQKCISTEVFETFTFTYFVGCYQGSTQDNLLVLVKLHAT